MKKFLTNFIFIIYVIIAVFVTVCLLSYNNFKITVFGDYALINVTNDTFNPNFNNGDLIIVDKGEKVNIGDKVFYYTSSEQLVGINIGEVSDMEEVTSTETTYILNGDHMISGQYVLGGINSTKVIPKVGTVLHILETKWGFLFLIVLPSVLAFLNQIAVVITEIKGTDDEK